MTGEIIEYPDYDISGKGNAKTILLLHGTGVTSMEDKQRMERSLIHIN